MKKNFKSYLIGWAIAVALFNVICFVTPSELAGMNKFGGAFWAGYIFIMLAFIGNAVCAWFTFQQKNITKVFYKLSIVKISYTGLVLTLIFGGLCMAVYGLPNWLGIIICMLILGFNAISIVKANTAAEIISEVDEKMKVQTQFIKLATVNAQNIMNRAKSDAAKVECKKVYEALRFSDPMSNGALAAEEEKITLKLDELSAAVNADSENVAEIAQEVVLLAADRNNKCKALK